MSSRPTLPTIATPNPTADPSPISSVASLLPSGTHLKVATTFTQSDLRFLAVGADGTAYGTKDPITGQSQLWASTDNARTWHRRGDALSGANFRTMAALADGTLLADTQKTDGTHVLARSDDGGRSWTDVLTLGTMQILTPHSVDELDGAVYLVEYQAYTQDSVPVHVWGSTDSGKTWQLRTTFTDRRHAHGIRADKDGHALWVFFGDNDVRTGMVRSTDGWHFSPVVTGPLGSAVDAVFTSMGMLFGQDVVFGTSPSSLQVIGSDETPHVVMHMPGPSYSIHPTPVGGVILCTTREPSGDVYAPGDDSAHLLASGDGVTWDDLLQFPRTDPMGYGRANVYWALPSGEMVVGLSDVMPTGQGYGYELIDVSVQK